MEVIKIVLSMLAVWRLSHMMARETGPLKIFSRIYNWLPVGTWKSLMECPLCLSVWLSVPFVVYLRPANVPDGIVLWLALSGAASIMEKLIEE
jgi:hypothetical protein